MQAIQTLIGEGISINVTLLFAVDAYAARPARGVHRGPEKYVQSGRNLQGRASSFSSAASTRWSTSGSRRRRQGGRRREEADRGLYGKVAIANGIVAYELQAHHRGRSLEGAGGACAADAACAVGEHQHEEPGLPEDHVRRRPDRAEHCRQYHPRGASSSSTARAQAARVALVADWTKTLAAAKETMKSSRPSASR
ncbi:MAG: hypothetical protein U0842_12485 [Candidatus Binatia bacterium]